MWSCITVIILYPYHLFTTCSSFKRKERIWSFLWLWPSLLLDFSVEVFYNVKNRLSFIKSKSSSKNLSNENKHCCFCCLLDKTRIKMPNLWDYRDTLTTFWRNKWQSVFDVVKNLCYWWKSIENCLPSAVLNSCLAELALA